VKHPGPPTAEALGVSRETEPRLRAYLDLLMRWNQRINLVAPAPAESLWQRHILDSAQLLPLLPAGDGPFVDLGSGGCFPGLVLAAATGWPTHLVESDKRKCAFLLEAARAMGLANVAVHARRIEDAALPPAAVLTARAFTGLSALLRHAHRLLAPGGVALFPKGRTAEQELAEATRLWRFRL